MVIKYIIAGLIALVGTGLGLALGYLLRKKIAQAEANSLEARADKLMIEAKNKQQEMRARLDKLNKLSPEERANVLDSLKDEIIKKENKTAE
jgi:uncharacterized protein YqfA (UPF0365 family)